MRSAKSRIGMLALICCLGSTSAEIDPQSNRFYFRDSNPFPDDTLGRISLYLIQQKRLEGNVYVSQSVEEGIVSYQIRFFDNGNKGLIDEEDKISIRRYSLSTAPEPPPPDPNAPRHLLR